MNMVYQPPASSLITFSPFSRLPLEIRCRIFKEAFPEPLIVRIPIIPFPYTNTIREWLMVLVTRYPELLPFLLACKESNAEVFRTFQKLVIIAPSSSFLKVRSDNIMYHTYIRPTIDTFILQATPFLELYERGGSINLSNITHLALDTLTFEPLRRADEDTDESLMRK
ncbi:hypothetical protein SBOR_8443 [Sclerotinia borealis F-4128]|uniref:2EXR domain-containing protein n=1 Tax=Sclerotinia borealis (strain F-4128) TaxID=1432307 RepID=W9C8H9_SCLBF|nr:hypothetical protein SBOR_8443 [Sclerotinia borealis F-4128]